MKLTLDGDWHATVTDSFGDDGVVLHFRVSGDEFEALNRRVFTEGDPELSEFVRRFRAGEGTEVPAYDVVEGPPYAQKRESLHEWRSGAPLERGSDCLFRRYRTLARSISPLSNK
jgi:hypothetical protein